MLMKNTKITLALELLIAKTSCLQLGVYHSHLLKRRFIVGTPPPPPPSLLKGELDLPKIESLEGGVQNILLKRGDNPEKGGLI